MLIRRVRVDRLNPAPYNPRVDLKPGDPEFEKLRRSIAEFGLVEPLVWNKRTGHLVGGHQRLKALVAEGAKEVDVSVVDLPLEREKALNVALNKVQGGWDQDKLAQLLDELSQLPDFDATLTGFDSPEIADLLADVLGRGREDQSEAFDLEAELAKKGPVVTKPGEILELGAHRLLCGDSTDPARVRELMNGERAVLFATDPPYLVGYDGTNHPGAPQGKRSNASQKKSKNKDWSATYGVTWDDAEANPELYRRFVSAAVAEAIRDDAAWYCWHASKRQAMLEEVWTEHGAFVHCQIVWAKTRPVLTRTWYAWMHEPCLMGWRQGNKPPRADSSVLPTVWQIATIANGPERPDHPTPKPLELFETPMRQHTKRLGARDGLDLCYEPFAGSGTQLIAAERLGRRCFAVEISPRYCDLVVRRWIAFVGERNAPEQLVARYARAQGHAEPRKPPGRPAPARVANRTAPPKKRSRARTTS